MSRAFNPRAVEQAAEALGLVYQTTEDGGMISGILPDDRERNIQEVSCISWKGVFVVTKKCGRMRVFDAKIEGDTSLEEALIHQLVMVPALAGKTSFGLTFWINIEEDLSPIARAAGMRIVAESGFTPTILTFVADFGRRGEVDWVEGKDSLSLAKALEANPAEEPVVLRKSDLEALLSFVGWALKSTPTTEAESAAIDAAKSVLNK